MKKNTDKNPFQELFERNPISLWEEDFTEVIAHLEKLKESGVTDVKSYLDAHYDFAQECAQMIKIININQASVDLHKAPNKEYLINNLQKTFNDRSFEVFKNELTAFANGAKSFESEYEIVSLTGETIYVFLKIFPINSDEKTLSRAIVSLYDINVKTIESKELKRINRQLGEERKVFTKENAVIFKWAYNKNWRIEYVSSKVEKVFGYTQEELLAGKISYADLIYKEDFKRILDDVNNAKTAELENFEHKAYRIVHKSGKLVWLNDYTTIVRNKEGNIEYYLGYVVDITQQTLLQQEKDELFMAVNKQRDEFEALSEAYKILNEELEYRNKALEESENRFKKLSDLTFEGILIHKDGIIKDINQSMARLTGYSREDVLNHKLTDFLVLEGEDAIRLQHNIKHNIDSSYELNLLKKDSSLFTAEIQARTIEYAGEQLRVVSIHDISERKAIEDHFQLLFQNAPLGIFIAKPDGTITDVNPSLIKILGSPSAEATKSINIVKFPLLVENGFSADFIEASNSGHILIKEYNYTTKWGKSSYLWEHIVPLKNKQGKTEKIFVIIEDITDRKRAEIELVDQKKLFETMFHTIPGAIIITDTERNIQLVNRAADKLFKYATESLIGLKADILYAEKQAFIDIGKKVFNKDAAEDIKQYKAKYLDKNGRSFDGETFGAKLFNDNGVWIGNLGVVRDLTEKNRIISELRHAKEKAEESENNYRNLFNSATDAIYIQDKEGYFIDVNQGAVEMYGYPKEYFIGKNPSFVSAPGKNDLKKIDEYIKLAFGGKAQKFDFWGIRKNGKVFPKMVRCQNGMYLGKRVTVAFAVDISERKKAEEELLKAKEKAEESDQLKSAFLNNLSHEIRTPLNGIMGFSKLLSNTNIETSKRRRFINQINNSSEQLLSIVEDIINISKIDSNQLKLFNENISVDQFLTKQYTKNKNKALEKGINIVYSKKPDKKHDLIYIDKKKLDQIMGNLIRNAIKFTTKGTVTFGCAFENGFLKFFVRDTGIGIDKSMHKKIFERFRQVELSTTRDYGGLGLGLAISKGYLAKMGGKIWMESELDKGSLFHFKVPYITEINDVKLDSKKTTMNSKSQMPKNKTILIAEDDDMNYALLVELLREKNVKILRAITGKEAINICLNNDIEPDLVLMDIKMPDLNGYEATIEIKKHKPHIPIIAQTAYAQAGDEEKSKKAGCDAYITKPIKGILLLEILDRYLWK